MTWTICWIDEVRLQITFSCVFLPARQPFKSTLFLTNCTEPQLLKKANKTIEFGIRSFDMDTLTRNNLSHCFKRTRQVGEFLPAFISFKSDFFEDIQLTTLYNRIDEMQFEEFPFCKSLTDLN